MCAVDKPCKARALRLNQGGIFVELALILPVLLLGSFGAINFGFSFMEDKYLVELSKAVARTSASWDLPATTSDDDFIVATNLLFNLMVERAGRQPADFDLDVRVETAPATAVFGETRFILVQASRLRGNFLGSLGWLGYDAAAQSAAILEAAMATALESGGGTLVVPATPPSGGPGGPVVSAS